MRSLVVIALLSSLAAPASAQMVVTVDSLGTRMTVDIADLETVMAAPINQSECDINATLTLVFTGVDTTRTSLHLFHGSMCDDPTVRNSMDNTSCVDYVLSYDTGAGMVTADIPVQTLVDCTPGTSGVRTVWALALSSPSDATDVSQYISFPIAYDFSGPAPPSGLVATGGEVTASLSWDAAGDQVSRYEVYVIPGGCTDGVVTGTITDPPDSSTYVGDITAPSTSGSVDFPDTIALGGEAAIAIVAVDSAGNYSTLSDVACVGRYEVVSWCESTGCAGGGCSASASPASPTPGAPWLALLMIPLALVFSRKR